MQFQIARTGLARFLGVAVIAAAFVAPSGARAEKPDGALAFAHELSDVFGSVAEQIRPSVVSVRSAHTIQRSSTQVSPFGNSPLREFFGDDLLRHFGTPVPRGPQVMEGQGSGFIISTDGYIVTNNHVVRDADEVEVSLPDGRDFTADVVGTDPRTDVAILHIDADDLVPVKIGNSDLLGVGDWVIAAGNPFGLTSTITAGIVSATGRSRMGIADYEDFIQTDAAINPGNSGGPLVNLEGEVVGVNTAIASRTGGNLGIGFAIPINMVEDIKYALIQEGRVTRGWLGVAIQDLNEGLADSFGYEGTEGVLVSQVTDDSPAERAGLKDGDIITTYEGDKVRDTVELRLLVAGTTPGTKAEVGLFRDGKGITRTVDIGELESTEADNSQSAHGPELGMSLRTITPEVANRLGLDENTRGVLVTQVKPLGPAARAGLSQGDLITRVLDTPVSNVQDLMHALRKRDLSAGVRLTVLSGGMKHFVFLRSEG